MVNPLLDRLFIFLVKASRGRGRYLVIGRGKHQFQKDREYREKALFEIKHVTMVHGKREVAILFIRRNQLE
jgi:hypothetical protein